MQISKQTFLWAGLIILVGVIAVSCSLFDRQSNDSPTMPEITPASVDLSNLAVNGPQTDMLGAGVEDSKFCVNIPGGTTEGIYEIQYTVDGGGTFCTTLEGQGVNAIIGLRAGDTLDSVVVNQYSLLGLLTGSAMARINNVSILSVPENGQNGCTLSKAGKVPEMTYDLVADGSVLTGEGVSEYACSGPASAPTCPFNFGEICEQWECWQSSVPAVCQSACYLMPRPPQIGPGVCRRYVDNCYWCVTHFTDLRRFDAIVQQCGLRRCPPPI